MLAKRFAHGIAAGTVTTLVVLFALPAAGEVQPNVERKVAPKVEPFGLGQVQLCGLFSHARQLDREYLLSLDVDRLLHNFRVNAGLPSSAEPLGGWEEPKCELRGHFVGHYLSACAMMYAGTGNKELRAKGERIVAGLAECQAKFPNGYLSAFPEEFIDRVEAGQRVWAPWYTLHKIYAGLLDMYVLCDNQQALEVAERAADWIKSRCDKLDDRQMEAMLRNEHGGMNDVLAELYEFTGDRKYLDLSLRFNHHAVLDPLTRREDRLTGLHANTQFPKVIGAARQYELTGEASLYTAATYFWDVVTKERSYVIGGNSDGEMFSPKEELSKHIGPSSTETCNTYNMLKLTRRLFCLDPKPEYADYYERALFNHIVASQNPETGMVCYYVPLKSGSMKRFHTPTDCFWCCVGTGVESPAKHQDSIYFHEGKKTLYVNQFIMSFLNWEENGLRLNQRTLFPKKDESRFEFRCEKPVELALKIRHPSWCVAGFEIAVNGQKQSAASTPGSYATVSRVWQDGDKVEVKLPMTLRTESFRDNPRKLALMYGPLVLCAELEPGQPLPELVAAQVSDVLAAVKPVEGEPWTFTGSADVFRGMGADGQQPVHLLPFYEEYQKPYVVYWDMLDEAAWQAKKAARAAEIARHEALQASTLDAVLIGREDSEREHGLKGEKTGAGEFGGRHWRHAVDGGWFSYEMQTLGDQPRRLLVAYWGNDGGGREFDILVDGTKIATEKLDRNRPDEFYDQVYPIPAELTQGKQKVTVRFQALPGRTAGGAFDCRILKKP